MRKITPVCLGVWMVAVWAAPGVEGTSGAPRVLVPVQAAPAPQADIEKGKAAVTQICVGCHDGGAIMRMVAVRKKTADEWRDTVYRMIGRGAQVFPDEIEPLTAYLTATGGQVPRSRQVAPQPRQVDAVAPPGPRLRRPMATPPRSSRAGASSVTTSRWRRRSRRPPRAGTRSSTAW